MHIQIFVNIIERMETRWKIILLTKFYNKHSTLNNLYIFAYQCIFYILKFPINA